MSDPRDPIFNFLRPHLKDGWNSPGLIEGFHDELDALGARSIDSVAPTPPIVSPAPAPPAGQSQGPLTSRVALELVGHEAIVLEAYKDSEEVWTWGVGVTDASGHAVGRYKDNPQTIRRALEVYIWLLRERYIPSVLAAFAGRQLTEAQFAAALSFHYNTGAIRKAGWVRLWKEGNVAAARAAIMEWRKPAEIIGRRTKERDLFFDGRWSADGKALVIPVSKPSYKPNFRAAQRVDVSADLTALLGASNG